MKRLRVYLLLGVLAGLWIGPSAVNGQGDAGACPAIVETALVVAGEACDGIGRNQACYGHATLEAEPQEGVDDWVFEQAGTGWAWQHCTICEPAP